MLARVIPVDLLAEERNWLYIHGRNGNAGERKALKKTARETALRKWQRSWDDAEVGRWTWNLVPLVQ